MLAVETLKTLKVSADQEQTRLLWQAVALKQLGQNDNVTVQIAKAQQLQPTMSWPEELLRKTLKEELLAK